MKSPYPTIFPRGSALAFLSQPASAPEELPLRGFEANGRHKFARQNYYIAVKLAASLVPILKTGGRVQGFVMMDENYSR